MTDETKKTVLLDEDEYKGLLAKNIAQATEISQVKAQLKDSTDALVLIKTKIDSAEKEESKREPVTHYKRNNNADCSNNKTRCANLPEISKGHL